MGLKQRIYEAQTKRDQDAVNELNLLLRLAIKEKFLFGQKVAFEREPEGEDASWKTLALFCEFTE